MAVIDSNRFMDLTEQWIRFRNPPPTRGRPRGAFSYNWPVKGGWESWIQVDLTAYCLANDSTTDILREQAIYTNPALRVDLVVNAHAAAADRIAIELKAQSFENRDRFIRGVNDDLEKLTTSVAPDYAASQCLMFGVCFEQQSADALLAIDWGGHEIFDIVVLNAEFCFAAACKVPGRGWIQARR